MDKKKYFDEVYREYAEKIFRFIYFRVSDFELSQDLTEETFVRFWKQILTKEVKNSKALLYTIVRGLIIDEYRKNEKDKMVSFEGIDERLTEKIDDVEEKVAFQQEMEYVFDRLKKVKKEYQEILLLHYIEDLKVEEIARILDKKESNVRVLLHRALKALKEAL